jgi:hypothetical protein
VTSTIAGGENFPIDVPSNVTILGAPSSVVTVSPPLGQTGFVLSTSGSGLQNLSIDGSANTAATAIHVASGGQSTLSGVSITRFASDGIVVSGSGSVTIEGGTTSQQNSGNGLYVTGNGSATILGGTTAAPISLVHNTQNGILIDMTGSINLTGVPGTAQSASAGTVLASQNGGGGIVVQQSVVSSAPFPPSSAIDGVTAYRNGGDGIRVYGSSSVVLRNSLILRNGASGVFVATSPSGTSPANSDITRIDLGQAPNDYGRNVLQDESSPNNDVGLCLRLSMMVSAPLHAAGNIFGQGLDCSRTNAGLNANSCDTGSTDAAGMTMNNRIQADQCMLN